MKITGEIKVDMAPINRTMKKLGVDRGGAVQRFHTANVRNRIQKYMPMDSGALIKNMIAASPVDDPYIHVVGPQAHYLYQGIVFVDPVTHAAGFMTKDGWRSRKGVQKISSGRPLNYNRSKNPQAGPLWDRRLKAAEMGQMQADLQAYIRTRGRSK